MELKLPSRYELDPVKPILGEGGMGRVLKVRDLTLDIPVALKVVRPDLAADKRFRKLFDLEVRTSARFTHPHIVPLHDLDEMGDGTPFLGLAFADEGSFANLREEMPSWGEFLRLVLELLDALSHLHARDVLHRDLKPENVLMYRGPDGERHVWLADLGLANAGSDLAKKKGRSEGTPGFWAPEQKLGLPREYGPWTDLYSVGVVMWDLITGSLPFPEGRSALDAELPALIPQLGFAIPERVEVILANLLAAEPMSRYDWPADLSTELRALGEATISREVVQSGDYVPNLRDSIGTVAPSYARSADESIEFVFGVPLWNRPIPTPLPEKAPGEPGKGATARGSVGLFALRELPLVARDRERQFLWDHARGVAESRKARVVIVVGETGAGKTRLVESVVWSLIEGGWAESVSLDYQDPPGKDDGYAGAARGLIKPWRETRESLEARLRRRMARAFGAVDDSVKEEASMLARWCGLVEEGEEPLADAYGLREIHRTLDARSWRGLSVLVLDSAQWSAEEGDGLAIAEAVLQAANDEKERPLLVLATVRSESFDTDPSLAAQVDQLVEWGAHRLDLPRLDRSGTLELLEESLTLAPALRDQVAKRCEGNPLFARQLLVDWSTRGLLVDTGGLQFGLAPGVDVDAALPADAEALFRSRIDTLAGLAADRQRFLDVLHMAGLSGIAIPGALMRALCGTGLYEFVLGTGIFIRKDDSVQFDHALMLQVVRNQAEGRSDLEGLHRRLARGWSRYGQRNKVDVAYEVGRHAYQGKDYRLAVGHLLKASETAWRRGRTKELMQTSLWSVEACYNSKRYRDRVGDALIWRGRAYQSRGESQMAARSFEEAVETFEAREEYTPQLAEALIGLGWSSRKAGDLDGAVSRYTAAMTRARAEGDVASEARAIQGMAWVEQQKRNFEGADILFTRVLNRASRIDDQRGAAEAALGQGFVMRRVGEFEEALELYEDAEKAYREAEDLLGAARALLGRGAVMRQQMKIEPASELFAEASQLAEELGATSLLMDCRLGAAEIHWLRKDYERAKRSYEAIVRWSERQGQFEARIFAHLGLAHVGMLERDLDVMYVESSKAGKLLDASPGHWLWAPYRLTVATLLAMRGEQDQTYRWLWSATELGLNDTVDHDIVSKLMMIVRVAKQLEWRNVLRVSGNLATSQWTRLGWPERAAKVDGHMRQVLG